MLPNNSRLIFRGIVGSQSYGLATETSDIDYKSIYIQDSDDLLSNKYVPQIENNKDDVAYELRRFLELVSTGNPNVLELLYLPERCIVETSKEYEYLRSIREMFLTKVCYNTYSGYARTQLVKASGINKKFNWEANKIIRKDIQDFAKVMVKQTGKVVYLKHWLKQNLYSEDDIGVTAIEGFRDCYKLYTDDLKWAKRNSELKGVEDRNYKGFGSFESNQPKVSQVEKYMEDSWVGVVYWNREAYSTHCKEYREYENWLKDRNENRVATNKKHGQQYDSKNILHLVRLIMTASEIPTLKTINVDRGKDREYLLDIKNGKLELKSVIEEWGKKVEELKAIYEKSSLPLEVNKETVKLIELKIRKNEL